MQCFSDADCSGDQRCVNIILFIKIKIEKYLILKCSNGCGRVCRTPVAKGNFNLKYLFFE